MAKSKIDYADWSWGIVDGCTHSGHPGCDHCWAKAMADRFWKDRKFSDVQIHPERLDEVVKLKPQVVFVAPMGDLFHPLVPTEFIEKAFITMSLHARQNKYIIFTKRPERMRDFMNTHRDFAKDHIWLGVSVSTQKDVDEFLPILCNTPAGKRIVSAEPLIEEINLDIDIGRGVGDTSIDNIDGIFAGCESGTGRRPADESWFESLSLQRLSSSRNVSLYVKQIDFNGKIIHKPYINRWQYLEFPDSF